MLKDCKIVGIGELLWDVLPSGKRLGGAPANFVFHAHSLGAQGIMVSSVGCDDLGDELVQTLEACNQETGFIQRHPTLQTGTVDVTIDNLGKPAYIINHPVAWDDIAYTNTFKNLAGTADAICFGTLAQRSPSSHQFTNIHKLAHDLASFVCTRTGGTPVHERKFIA